MSAGRAAQQPRPRGISVRNAWAFALVIAGERPRRRPERRPGPLGGPQRHRRQQQRRAAALASPARCGCSSAVVAGSAHSGRLSFRWCGWGRLSDYPRSGSFVGPRVLSGLGLGLSLGGASGTGGRGVEADELAGVCRSLLGFGVCGSFVSVHACAIRGLGGSEEWAPVVEGPALEARLRRQRRERQRPDGSTGAVELAAERPGP
mmetsp:Transcript_93337/g.237566  ORF Transcript_93337/g.237566 Transcript_93337/m.237566 type:complete len:205 (-) Transcript_93337:177-791(-)